MNKIKDFYYKLKYPSSFSSINKIHEYFKEKKLNVSRSLIKNWLQKQEVYTINKLPIKKISKITVYIE